jgi:putative membrane protein
MPDDFPDRYWRETEPPWDRRNVPWIVRIAVRWGITMLAFIAADYILGNDIEIDSWKSLLTASAIFVAARAVLRPALLLLTCPLQIITFGLFIFVVNALVLTFVDWLCDWWGIAFTVDGFIAAFLGALIISAVSFVLDRFLRRDPFAFRA